MKDNLIKKILDVIKLSERLKFELRHSWLSNGQQESVADHCWQMSFLALLLYRYLEHPVDLEKTLKMIVIHDIVEAEIGDIPCFETGHRKESKYSLECKAIENIRMMLSDEKIGEELYNLWHEFQAGDTIEAKFVKALDNLEVQIQHNLANLSTWEEIEYDLVYTKMDKHCCHDEFLQAFCDYVKLDAETKMKSGGIDVNAIKKGKII
ncbi:MAG: HD domain-containing protein [Candidatus Aminicenantes bacterium]|nr:MAG: HD domain-containing protein [Candidatus Aminicenantes bacterium]